MQERNRFSFAEHVMLEYFVTWTVRVMHHQRLPHHCMRFKHMDVWIEVCLTQSCCLFVGQYSRVGSDTIDLLLQSVRVQLL